MANLVDRPEDEVLQTTAPANEVEEAEGNLDDLATQESERPEADEPTSNVDSDLPEKYQGKSASEIAQMHRELEQRLGTQSQEVGELRKAFDDMVQSNIAAQQQPSAPQEELTDVDFFADPQAAMQRAIENHPTLKQAQAVAVEMAKSKSLAQLQAAHPDMKDVLSDKGFGEWVGGSSVRKELFERADTGYDFEAANELLSLYKERRGVVKQTAAAERVAKKNEVKKASTGSARSNPEGAKSSRKTYRRRDIIELMNSDPKRYDALMPEIMKAYSEGRVK